MKKVYNVKFHEKIKPVEITRETDANVWIKDDVGNEVKHIKRTSDGWNDFFETSEDARQHIVKFNQLKIEKAKKDIESAEAAIKKALEWSEK